MKTKRLLSLAMAATLLLTVAVSAFAANSPTTGGTVTSAPTATDAKGNAITIKLESAPAAVVADAKKVDTVKAVMGAAFNDKMAVLDVKEVVAPAGTEFPAKLTFNVTGVTASTKGAFMHWNGSAWEKIDATFGAGTMTGTFTSLSPVAFVLDTTTLASTDVPSTGNTTPSPDTRDLVMPVLALTGLCLLGAAYAGKKARG